MTFTATATGTRTGTVVATYTGGSLTSTLSGTGLAAGGVCIIPPIVGAACDALYTYNSQTVGLASSDSPILPVLSNTSGSTATSLGISFTGTNAGDFTSPSTTCSTSLANNSICQIGATFTPSATGSRTGNLSVSYGGGGGGTVLTAASCSVADITSVWPTSGTGVFTINVPAGSCTWTSQLSLTVPATGITSISLIGQTVCSPNTPGVTATSCTDNTVILNHLPSAGSEFAIHTGTTNTTVHVRISGFSLKEDSSSIPTNNCMFSVSDDSQFVRVDDMHFWESAALSGSNCLSIVYNNVAGVFDHNVFDMTGSVDNGTRISNQNLFGDSSGNGNGSWSNPTNFGSSQFVFFENSTYNYGISNDCNDGGRFVFRHNTFNNSSIQAHEMEGDARGCRGGEVYGNTFNGNASDHVNSFTAFGPRMGTWLVWGNTSTNMKNFISLGQDRTNGHPFGLTPGNFGYCGKTAWNGIVNTSGDYSDMGIRKQFR